ncbi:SAM-dependent methyltransferase [Stutzerimonas xanthomarina]|nr:SAM-dependent methyltransferase [Stutzerimonas xanthomarina]HBB78674.1 protein-glutamate O-methyltransferase CheR [Pseudomonas sp.]
MPDVTEAAVAGRGVYSISDTEFRLFQQLMFNEAGVTLAPSKKALVNGRLSKRLTARDCPSFRAYYDLLSQDSAEWQWAIDLLTTNETYFFREPRHFDYLREKVLPAHAGGRAFRVWSAACSSGEEAYSTAMVLADAFGAGGWSVLGSDLNTQVLAKARSGHYGMARTEGIPRASLERYCLKGKGSQTGTFLVGRPLRERVEFRQINLNTTLPRLEPFDVIFLRNVMIYFSQATKAQIVRRVIGLLKPGGHFIIGHSESLNGITDGLEVVRPSIYRRPA